jgi:hypothetical protein
VSYSTPSGMDITVLQGQSESPALVKCDPQAVELYLALPRPELEDFLCGPQTMKGIQYRGIDEGMVNNLQMFVTSMECRSMYI